MRSRAVIALATVLMLISVGCRAGEEGPTQAGEITTGAGVEGQTIRIGELSPLSGPVAVIGEPLTNGHRVYFNYVNEELGGIGRDLDEAERFRVELVEADTLYLPERHVEQFNGMRNQVLAIGQSLGTQPTKAILPELEEDPILTGPATLSVDWLEHDFMFPAGAPYAVQFINAADYLVNEQDVTPRAGIIYQDDDYGQEGVNGLEYAAEEFGFDIVARAAFAPTDQDFTAQVNEMNSNGVDTVFLTATPTAAGQIFGAAATQGYTARWIAQSPVWARALFTSEQLGPYLQANVWWVSDASCDWGETGEGCEGMEQMLANIQTYDPEQEPDAYFLFGYTQARILHEILEQAIENGNLTREGVIEAVADLDDIDIGGLLNPISLGPDCEDRIPATASNIFRVNPEAPLAVEPIAEVDSDAVEGYPFCPGS